MAGQTIYSAQNAFGRLSRVRLTTQSGATKSKVAKIACIKFVSCYPIFFAVFAFRAKTQSTAKHAKECSTSPIYFPKHDIQRPNDRHNIGHKMTNRHSLQRLQV